jgi:hypothetical protein
MVKTKRINGSHSSQSLRGARSLLSKLTSFRVATQDHLSVVRSYLEALDCPRSLAVWLMFVNNEHQQLVDLTCDPSDFDEKSFPPSYRATLFLSKYQGFKLDIDRKAVALEKFDSFELLCKKTNSRFRNLGNCTLYKGTVPKLHNAVRVKISKILGQLDVSTLLASADWGPGATTLMKGRDACRANKFQSESGITRDLHHLLSDCGFFNQSGFSPLWSEALEGRFPTFQVGNRLEFVPKNSKIDRPIAIEPGINLWFQKAIGSLIRERLRKWGIDLNDQTTNQRLAKLASIDNILCTVDFSSASDSIARSVVEELLPPRWFLLMDLCRSHYGTSYRDNPVLWEKFSSMGNGFTFELESLIFFAIALCVCEEDSSFLYKPSSNISVYGDDVILPSCYFQRFSEVCTFYGFKLNEEKSFVNSDFRESCGVHYFRGIDCKPIYLKDRLKGIVDLFKIYNAIRRQSRLHYGCDIGFRSCCNLILSVVPKSLRLRIPDEVGDTGFIGNLDEACPTRNRHYVEGYSVVGLREVSRLFPFEGLGLLLDSLWLLERRGDVNTSHVGVLPEKTSAGNYVSRRGETALKLSRSVVSSWVDLGPWF